MATDYEKMNSEFGTDYIFLHEGLSFMTWVQCKNPGQGGLMCVRAKGPIHITWENSSAIKFPLQ